MTLPPAASAVNWRFNTLVRMIACGLVLALSACSQRPSLSEAPDISEIEAATALATSQSSDLSAIEAPADDPPEDEITTDPSLIWLRIKSGYALPDRLHPAVEYELAQMDPKSIQTILDRSRPFIHIIVEEVEKRRMPMELAMLPAIESGFNPMAYSTSNAVGLWQFIPSTGKEMGLRGDWWYDGRRDVVESTDAALDYLQSLSIMFNGDWLLALAAYNAGPGYISREIRKNAQRGLPTDYWNLTLYEETRRYVPKLLAVSHIIAHPSRYQVQLPVIPNDSFLAVVELDSPIDLSVAANLAGLSTEEMKRYNAGYSRRAMMPRGPYRLMIPENHTAQFQDRLAQLPEAEKIPWMRHKVRKGETLQGIARRYRMPADEIAMTNNLKSRQLRAGSDLLLPPEAAHHPSTKTAKLVKGKSKTPLQQSGKSKSYVVAPGDTLWSIARKNNITTQQIIAWNKLTTKTALRPGQKLTLRQDNHADTLPSKGKMLEYTVQKGDSIYGISQRHNISPQNLRRWNNINSDNQLRVGQRLVMRADASAQNEN